MGKPVRRRFARLGVRCGALFALVALLALGPPAAAPWVLSALSPHLAAVSSIALRTAGLVAACGVPMLVLVAWRRRWFCRWLCPVGLIVEACGKAAPFGRPELGRVPPLGQWAALASVGGALLGVPLLLWADPLSIFSGAVGALRGPVTVACALAAGPLGLVVLLSLAVPNLWCARLCPLGGTQELLAGLKRRLARRPKPAPPPEVPADRLARRAVLCAGAGAACAAAIPRLFRGSTDGELRPPGALDEMRFKALCVRCGNCVRACPSRIIVRQLAGEASGFLTPVVRFPPERPGERYCLETCHACTRSCPTGAIRPLTLAEKNRRPIGLAEIDLPDCLITLDQTCAVCQAACPQDAISLVFHRETYTNAVVVDPARCNGCGACLVVCPVNVISIRRV